MKGFVNQIDAQHKEDDARRERSQGGNDGMGGWQKEEDGQGEVWRWFELFESWP